MSAKIFALITLFLAAFLLLPLFNFKSGTVFGREILGIESETTVSVSLGKPRLVLWGYGPASSVVKLEGVGVSDSTLSNNNGYFQFTGVFVPLRPSIEGKKLLYPEICIQAIDSKKLTTQPTCIPQLPFSNYLYNIGPVILSPTITLEKGGGLSGETIKASGKTLPNSNVEIYLARQNSPGNFFEFTKEANAYYIPKYQIESDENGLYEFNLPTDTPENWKVFTSAKYINSNSAKSNTLVFEVLPYWMYLVRQILTFVGKLRPYYFYIFLFLQVVAVILLVRHAKKKNKPTQKLSKKHRKRTK